MLLSSFVEPLLLLLTHKIWINLHHIYFSVNMFFLFCLCRYKLVELAFYLTMGFFPASVVTSMVVYLQFVYLSWISTYHAAGWRCLSVLYFLFSLTLKSSGSQSAAWETSWARGSWCFIEQGLNSVSWINKDPYQEIICAGLKPLKL